MQGEDIVPIPGTSSIERLEENVAAAKVDLTLADRARIEAVAPRGAAAGARYNEAGLPLVNA